MRLTHDPLLPMRSKTLILVFIASLYANAVRCQGFPWERPLKMAWSVDGITFNTPQIFQDSAGVPSVIQWKGDTLACVFQWFRSPVGSASWDRVAVKFSYDNGGHWTTPTPIVINGLPATYQRPFDPTLLALNPDSLRIYFSSSDGMPVAGLDSSINTYSAVSTDGIHYTFEPNSRVDELSNRVIDPAVIRFNHACHYAAPIGSPQQGAYHYISPDGLTFTKVADIPSDALHNWTGNYMLNDSNEIRFYGSGPSLIWFNTSPNGGVWNGYTATNIQGGDPGVVRLANGNYLVVYVGHPYATGIPERGHQQAVWNIYPNPVANSLHLETEAGMHGLSYHVYDPAGRMVCSGTIGATQTNIDLSYLVNGWYVFSIEKNTSRAFQLAKP